MQEFADGVSQKLESEQADVRVEAESFAATMAKISAMLSSRVRSPLEHAHAYCDGLGFVYTYLFIYSYLLTMYCTEHLCRYHELRTCHISPCHVYVKQQT